MEDPIIKELQVERTTAPMILVIGQTGAGTQSLSLPHV